MLSLRRFKLWLFTWMGIGGVETEHEYHISHRHLCIWLDSFANQASHLQHNAQVLGEFLLQRIDPFKGRLFFAGRNRRLTLNHKTTSPLESINQSLKKMLPWLFSLTCRFFRHRRNNQTAEWGKIISKHAKRTGDALLLFNHILATSFLLFARMNWSSNGMKVFITLAMLTGPAPAVWKSNAYQTLIFIVKDVRSLKICVRLIAEAVRSRLSTELAQLVSLNSPTEILRWSVLVSITQPMGSLVGIRPEY